MNDFKHKEHVTQTPDVSYIKNVNVTHETSDVQVPSIARFVIALLVLTIVIHVALWGMFRALERKEAQKDIQRSPMALSDKERLPPEPRLQGAPAFAEQLEQTSKQHQTKERSVGTGQSLERPKDPQWEIKVLREQWNDVLEHGPVDQNGSRYGMPIDEAKKKIIEQGLPAREQKAVGSRQ